MIVWAGAFNHFFFSIAGPIGRRLFIVIGGGVVSLVRFGGATSRSLSVSSPAFTARVLMVLTMRLLGWSPKIIL